MKYLFWVIVRILEPLCALCIAALFLGFNILYFFWHLRPYRPTANSSDMSWSDIKGYFEDWIAKLKGTYVEPPDPWQPVLTPQMKQVIRESVEDDDNA